MEDKACRGGHETYPECKHIPRSKKPELSEAETLALPPSANENVLPLFESKVSNYKRKKLCSLQTNELLQCRWRGYVRNFETMKRVPFEFPKVSNFHFHNNTIKYMASETPESCNLKRRMKVGPGSDEYGQMPIPDDMHVAKGSKPAEKPKPLRYSKAKKHKH